MRSDLVPEPTTFRQTLLELEKVSKDLNGRGIVVSALDQAITDLQKHQENIEAVEAHIDAIREEVLQPIRKELNENKTAGAFSVFGFWIGAIGLLVSVVTIVIQFFPHPKPAEQSNLVSGSRSASSVDAIKLLQKLDSIEHQLLFPNSLQPHPGDLFGMPFRKVQLARIGEKPLSAMVTGVEFDEQGDLWATFQLYKGDNQLGDLESVISRKKPTPKSAYWARGHSPVRVGDFLKIGNLKVTVSAVRSEKPGPRILGDANTGVLFKVGR